MKKETEFSSRRDFLSTAGIVLTTLQSVDGKSYQTPKTMGCHSDHIDCQSHLFVPELLSLMEKRKDPPRVYRQGDDLFVVVGEWHRRVLPKHMDIHAKLADMDQNGIQLTALSINDPGPELFGKEGTAIARMVNDYIAQVVKQYPTRFLGLAVLPLQDMEPALSELDRCVNKLGMKGVLVYSNLNGKFPDLPEYGPL